MFHFEKLAHATLESRSFHLIMNQPVARLPLFCRRRAGRKSMGFDRFAPSQA